MGKDYKVLADQMLTECRESVGTGMLEVYGKIEKELWKVTPSILVQKMIDKEAEYVNNYAKELVQSVKEAAIKVACEGGVSNATAGIIWANVMSETGFPKVVLCKREKAEFSDTALVRGKGGRKREHSLDKKSREEIDLLMRNKRKGKLMAVVGVTGVVVTSLIVPGLDGMKIIVVKGAEVLLMGAGAFQMFQANRRIEEINRIVNQTAETEKVRSQSFEQTVTLLCDAQRKANLAVFEAWLDMVKAELIRQIGHELD